MQGHGPRISDVSRKTIIEQWFQRTGGGGLVLPDGWYGRPFDNLLRLTSVTDSGDRLTLVLEDNITLSFTGPVSVQTSGNELLLVRFDDLIFEARAFGAPEVMVKAGRYGEGEVKIISM
jgi:hypothetical protein